MAALQRVAQSSVSTSGSSSYVSCKPDRVVVSDQFPAGLRVLVVDDEAVCLRVLDHMLRRCNYHATTCSQATVALNLLREKKGCFDVVLCDVHMPDMDGFKLLEHVGLEMDLPVIMMSADATTSAVMKGIRHGACDYLIKPVREEELKNIWQHVVRKKWNQNKELDHSGSLEDSDRHKRGNDDAEYASSINEGTEGTMKPQKKRSSAKEDDDGELENEDPSATKKPRVVWSVELHQQFVSAVSQLGIDKAVPKRILELMNVPGLTRENVASHLQKFRLYLKRLSGMGQQGGISSTLCGNIESNIKLASLGRYEIQALAASGQIPPQTLAALHAELLGQPAGNLVTAVDQPALLQASLLGRKYIPVEPGFAFSQPLVKCQSNMSKHFHQSIISAEDATSGFGAWPSNNLGAVGPGSNLGGLSSHNSNVLMDILHQQQQQQQKQQQQQSTPSEPSRTINVQPSCLVVPSQSTGFQAGNSPTSVNQNCNFSRAAGMDYSLLSSQSNTSLSIGEISDVDIKNSGVLSGYSVPGSISPSASCCSVNADNSTCQQVQNSTAFGPCAKLPELLPNVCGFQSSCDTKSGEAIDQKLLRNLGFVGKGTCIPSRFAVDELESPINNLNHGKAFMECNVNKMKQEPSMEFMDNTEVDRRVLQQFPPNDLMSVFTE